MSRRLPIPRRQHLEPCKIRVTVPSMTRLCVPQVSLPTVGPLGASTCPVQAVGLPRKSSH